MMISEEILGIVTEFYQTPDADLLLLSHLGKTLADRGLWPAPGDKRSLYEAVEAAAGVRLIRDQKSSSYIAVVREGDEQLAHASIADRHRRYFLRGLPRALILAFTLPIIAGQVITVTFEPKVTYRIGDSPTPGETTIDEDLRVSVAGRGDLEAMSTDDVERLDANVRAWADRHAVDLDTLKRRPTPLQKAGIQTPQQAVGTALERLFAAQDPDVARKMIIPVDIAVLLGRTP